MPHQPSSLQHGVTWQFGTEDGNEVVICGNSSDGFVTVRPAEPNKVLSTAQALNLLKSRGYMIKDDVPLTVS